MWVLDHNGSMVWASNQKSANVFIRVPKVMNQSETYSSEKSLVTELVLGWSGDVSARAGCMSPHITSSVVTLKRDKIE